MNGADWIADKINSGEGYAVATVEGPNVVFVERGDKPSARIGVMSTRRGDAAPLLSLDDVKAVYAENPHIVMMVVIPKAARWSGESMKWLENKGVAFGGFGDLLSALIYDEDMSAHRNKTFAFVDDGLRRHSKVADLVWIDSKSVQVHLINGTVITVVLEDAYDITMIVARKAGQTFGRFDVLLKTNPNGSITSSGAENVEKLGFKTLKWGELFGYIAKRD